MWVALSIWEPIQLSQRDRLTSNPEDPLQAVQFYATILDTVNNEGIPPGQEEFGSFEQIHDIDYICQQAGGRVVSQLREPFAPFLGGRCWEKALTAYRVGNVLVVNRSFGYHPDRRTTIIIPEGESPDTDIVDRFKRFYCKEPRSVQPNEILRGS